MEKWYIKSVFVYIYIYTAAFGWSSGVSARHRCRLLQGKTGGYLRPQISGRAKFKLQQGTCAKFAITLRET